MKWEWDSGADNRVAKLWFLREELARSGEVIYSKWYKGRATFFSKAVFTAMLAHANCATDESRPDFRQVPLSSTASELYELLLIDSPLSTKELKKRSDLRGKFYEGKFAKGLKELWVKFLAVGYGEIDDGAFPSLAIGATKNLFEDVYAKACRMTKGESRKKLSELIPTDSPFLKFFKKT